MSRCEHCRRWDCVGDCQNTDELREKLEGALTQKTLLEVDVKGYTSVLLELLQINDVDAIKKRVLAVLEHTYRNGGFDEKDVDDDAYDKRDELVHQRQQQQKGEIK